MGGAYWEKNRTGTTYVCQLSPHLFVEMGYAYPLYPWRKRLPYSPQANQAMAAFDAAVMRGVPAELLIYPDENHWVLKPQNGVLWQRTFF